LLFYLLGLIFSPCSCFLLFLHALAFIFSVSRSFSLPEFSFFQSGTSPWHELCYSAVVLRRSAWSRSSRFGRAALFCVAWICADARVIRSCSMGGLALPYPRPSSLHFRDVQVRFSAPGHWPCSSWGGRDGSICRGDRIICQLHQLGPPLCGSPHRRPSPRAPRSGLVGCGVLPEELSSIWQVGTLYASSWLESLRGFTSGR